MEMALGRNCQLVLEQDRCTGVYFLWRGCHHQSGGRDTLHPQTSAVSGMKRRLLLKTLFQKIETQSSQEESVLQPERTGAVGCWLGPPSPALHSSFHPSLWLSLCPGSHTWNVCVAAAGRKRDWCSPAHRKRTRAGPTVSGHGCLPGARAASAPPWSWSAGLCFGGSRGCLHCGWFSPRG